MRAKIQAAGTWLRKNWADLTWLALAFTVVGLLLWSVLDRGQWRERAIVAEARAETMYRAVTYYQTRPPRVVYVPVRWCGREEK